MSESIEAPKRKYTRKPKVVALTDVLSSDSEKSTTSSDSGLTPTPEVPQKPKRQYKKKVTIAPVEPVDEIPPPPVLEDTPPSSPEPVKEKKPRTDKQKEAFEKMRLARISKQEELKKLKEIEREQKQLEREQTKLNNITDKIVEKTESIKQRKTKKTTEKFDVLPEPQYVPQIEEKKVREILFL